MRIESLIFFTQPGRRQSIPSWSSVDEEILLEDIVFRVLLCFFFKVFLSLVWIRNKCTLVNS